MSQDQNPVETPTNRSTRRSLRTVEERKPSKEFTIEGDHLTVEVVHAERILREYFEKLGYEEWIYGSCCSRKLLDRLVNRSPAPEPPTDGPLRRPIPVQQWHVNPNWIVPANHPEAFTPIHEGPEPRPFTVADGIQELAPFTTAAAARVEQHMHERRMRQELNQIVEANTARNPDGTPYQGTAGGPANDPAHDTPF